MKTQLTYRQLVIVRNYLCKFIPEWGNEESVRVYNKIQKMIRETPEYQKQLKNKVK